MSMCCANQQFTYLPTYLLTYLFVNVHIILLFFTFSFSADDIPSVHPRLWPIKRELIGWVCDFCECSFYSSTTKGLNFKLCMQ